MLLYITLTSNVAVQIEMLDLDTYQYAVTLVAVSHSLTVQKSTIQSLPDTLSSDEGLASDKKMNS